MLLLAVGIAAVLTYFWPALTRPAPAPPAVPDRSIDYVEFATTDIDATAAFFEGAFGWRFVDYEPDYAAHVGPVISVGLRFGRPPDDSATPLVFVHAADLELTRVAVQSAGGEIVRPIFDFPAGRRFHAREPGGNVIAVWSEN